MAAVRLGEDAARNAKQPRGGVSLESRAGRASGVNLPSVRE